VRLALALLATLTLAVAAPMAARGQEARGQGRPVLDAREFPSIQHAVDGLPPGGGTVLISAGTHVLPKKVRLPSHVELRGEGIDRTVLVLADGANDHLISNRDLRRGNAGIVIRDLGLRGNAAAQSGWSFGVRLVNVADALVENVEASDFATDGFYLGYNAGNGARDVRVSGCRAVGNRRYGLALKHGTGNVVEGCTFEGNGLATEGAGLKLGPDQGLDASGNRIVGNRAVGNQAGFVLYAAVGYGSRVADNAVCQNHAEGNVLVGFQDFRGEGNLFVGNTASGNGLDFDLGPAAGAAGAGC
jgi:parallel beta-helix repeat protein